MRRLQLALPSRFNRTRIYLRIRLASAKPASSRIVPKGRRGFPNCPSTRKPSYPGALSILHPPRAIGRSTRTPTEDWRPLLPWWRAYNRLSSRPGDRARPGRPLSILRLLQLQQLRRDTGRLIASRSRSYPIVPQIFPGLIDRAPLDVGFELDQRGNSDRRDMVLHVPTLTGAESANKSDVRKHVLRGSDATLSAPRLSRHLRSSS